MPRMNILSTVEREAFDSPPAFNSVQRKQYFDFPSQLRRFVSGLRRPTHMLGFLLSAGCSKVARRFFPSSIFHTRDIEYVARQLELAAHTFDSTDYPPRTRQRHLAGLGLQMPVVAARPRVLAAFRTLVLPGPTKMVCFRVQQCVQSLFNGGPHHLV